MSASEVLFFTKYFGLMVGDYVPPDNEAWKLYIKLRSIIDIITAPEITTADLTNLELLIEQHHELYKEQFGKLKATFHLMTHYIRSILKNELLSITSSMRIESKHRMIKSILSAISNRINPLKSVAERHQLALMKFTYSKYKNVYVTYASKVLDNAINIYFPNAESKIMITNFKVNDFTYKQGTIFVADIGENLPCFGEIDKIYLVDNDIYLKYNMFQTFGFDEHYFAYSVSITQIQKFIKYDSLDFRTPCIIDEKEGIQYIATRYRL